MNHRTSLASAVLCLTVLALSQLASCKADAMYDYYEGYKYSSEITDQQVQHAPQWSLTEDNPPLPARKAAAAATKVLRELLPDADKWTLSSISLQPVCGHAGWAYVITFDSYFHRPPGIASGVPIAGSGYLPDIHFYVLLSGTVIEPTVTQGKPRGSVKGLPSYRQLLTYRQTKRAVSWGMRPPQ